MNLIPAILSDDINQVQEQLALINQVEAIRTVQIDVIDGQFANNMTVTPLDLTDLDFGRLKVDFHLMVTEPMSYVHELIEVEGRLPVRAVIGQVEQMSHQSEFIKEVKNHQWQPGLALNVFTPLTAIQSEVWSDLSLVQLLGVEAGHQGQDLQPLVFDKIAQLTKSDHRDELELMVDGGIKLEHLDRLKKLGVDSVAVGSAILKQDDPMAQARQFIESIQNVGSN